jgi:hypothetical protein
MENMTENPLENLFFGFSKKIVEYSPNLLAGLLLIGIGWLLGWLLKRIIIRLCMAFRLDRALAGFRWSGGLSKSDVRHALYNFIGNAAMLIVFLIFLNDALSVMDLTFLSSLLEGAIFFLPKFLTALVIFIAGWILSGWASGAIHKGLLKEGIPRAALIARFSKTVLLLFFSAMALTELDIAREIVIIGFATIIITLAVITVVLTTRGGKTLVDSILHAFEED